MCMRTTCYLDTSSYKPQSVIGIKVFRVSYKTGVSQGRKTVCNGESYKLHVIYRIPYLAAWDITFGVRH